jgi:hypothetical protein
VKSFVSKIASRRVANWRQFSGTIVTVVTIREIIRAAMIAKCQNFVFEIAFVSEGHDESGTVCWVGFFLTLARCIWDLLLWRRRYSNLYRGVFLARNHEILKWLNEQSAFSREVDL